MEDTQKSVSIEIITSILKAARKHSKKPQRDLCLIWISYRHGLRVSEAINLKWKHIKFDENRIYINRAKGSISGYHPLSKEDRTYLLNLKRTLKYTTDSDYLFQNLNNVNISRQSVYRIISKLCKIIKIDNIHPHTLRHSCGNHMAMAGISTIHIKEWLGHKNIENTVIYTQEAGKEFDNLKEWW